MNFWLRLADVLTGMEWNREFVEEAAASGMCRVEARRVIDRD